MAKILLIEDEPDIRDLVRMALEIDGHEVRSAATADEGLARARDMAPDCILMDIALGGPVDGLEVTRRLRADARFDGTPIIALTAHAMAGDRERALAAGCDTHLAKPIINLIEFKEMVTRVAAEGRAAAGAEK